MLVNAILSCLERIPKIKYLFLTILSPVAPKRKKTLNCYLQQVDLKKLHERFTRKNHSEITDFIKIVISPN